MNARGVSIGLCGLSLLLGTAARAEIPLAKSDNAEVEAARRLWIDVATFLPRRFEYVYGVSGYGDYSLDLSIER